MCRSFALLFLLQSSGFALANEVEAVLVGHATSPTLSPDGAWVAWEHDTEQGGVGLMIAPIVAGTVGEARAISLPEQGPYDSAVRVALQPTWHSSGALLFEGSDNDGGLAIWAAQPAQGLPWRITNSPGNSQFPVASREGSQLILVSEAGLRLRDLDAGQAHSIASEAGAPAHPDLSPDGTMAVFSRGTPAYGQDIYLVDLLTGEERLLLPADGDQTRPVFAEAGATVLCFAQRPSGSGWDLLAIDVETRAERLLLERVRLPSRRGPAVSPDGAWAAVVLDEGLGQLALVELRTGALRAIPAPQESPRDPALGADASGLLLAYTDLPLDTAGWRELTLLRVSLSAPVAPGPTRAARGQRAKRPQNPAPTESHSRGAPPTVATPPSVTPPTEAR